ncbi:hypothetical protein N7491_006259 [Penicillium cf. griseofulvum]|nr:hypothetical protein N7491_006259 [Penicillium cf. griseofulvum]
MGTIDEDLLVEYELEGGRATVVLGQPVCPEVFEDVVEFDVVLHWERLGGELVSDKPLDFEVRDLDELVVRVLEGPGWFEWVALDETTVFEG